MDPINLSPLQGFDTGQDTSLTFDTLAGQFPQLRCMNGTAEKTGLQSHAADLVTVAQALHWFDLEEARNEFSRILRPGGWCAVIYNERRTGGDGFHDNPGKGMRDANPMLTDGQFQRGILYGKCLGRVTPMDFAGLAADALAIQAYRGFMTSVSYTYLRRRSGDPAYLAALDELFQESAYTHPSLRRRGKRWLWVMGAAAAVGIAVVIRILMR